MHGFNVKERGEDGGRCTVAIEMLSVVPVGCVITLGVRAALRTFSQNEPTAELTSVWSKLHNSTPLSWFRSGFVAVFYVVGWSCLRLQKHFIASCSRAVEGSMGVPRLGNRLSD